MRSVLFIVILISSLFSKDMDKDFFEDLKKDLDTYSQLAIDTKQNIDYMPHIVSVLKYEELSKLGILSLREALSLVPGIDLSVDMSGIRNPIFRGSNPFAVGQSKLIIDGTVVNDKMYSSYSQYLDMPIDIIQRIEVVRGPGSLINGVNAYAGSIHVITKANRVDKLKKENSVFTSFGSDRYKMGGYVSSYKEKDFELNSDFFYQEHDRKTLTGPDRFNNTLNAPLWLENYALGLSTRYKDLYLKGRFSKSKMGVGYGQSFSLSYDDTDFMDVKNNLLELGYKFDLYEGVGVTASAGYFDEHRKLQNEVMPDGSSMIQNGIKRSFPQGYYYLFDYSEQTLTQSVEVKVSTFDNHSINLGIQLEQSSVKRNRANHSNDNLETFFESGPILSNNSRGHESFYFNDLVDISEKVSLEYGFQFDRYSDVKNQFNPRIAFVYRYDDDNILKWMYSHSFREPSWREQYLVGAHYFNSSSKLIEEDVEAYEASYIRKLGLKNSFKINVYYLYNKHQIHFNHDLQTFTNYGHNKLYGLEAEFKTNLFDKDEFYINYSYVDGSNISNEVASSAKNMAKIYYIYNFNESFNASSIIEYVGTKDRVENDLREKVDDYVTVDLSFSYKYRPYDFTISASLKNMFDEKYFLPSIEKTYRADFQQEGRSFLIRLSKRF